MFSTNVICTFCKRSLEICDGIFKVIDDAVQCQFYTLNMLMNIIFLPTIYYVIHIPLQLIPALSGNPMLLCPTAVEHMFAVTSSNSATFRKSLDTLCSINYTIVAAEMDGKLNIQELLNLVCNGTNTFLTNTSHFGYVVHVFPVLRNCHLIRVCSYSTPYCQICS